MLSRDHRDRVQTGKGNHTSANEIHCANNTDMSENEKSTTGWYKHDTAENCQLFHMKIKTKVMQHKDETVRNNMKKLMKLSLIHI